MFAVENDLIVFCDTPFLEPRADGIKGDMNRTRQMACVVFAPGTYINDNRRRHFPNFLE